MAEPRESDFEDFLARRSSVSRRYREEARDEPPAQLDGAILAAARREVGAGPVALPKPWFRRLQVPLGIAAVLVLGLGLTLRMLDHEKELGAPPVASEPAAVSADAGAVRDEAKPADGSTMTVEPPAPAEVNGSGLAVPEPTPAPATSQASVPTEKSALETPKVEETKVITAPPEPELSERAREQPPAPSTDMLADKKAPASTIDAQAEKKASETESPAASGDAANKLARRPAEKKSSVPAPRPFPRAATKDDSVPSASRRIDTLGAPPPPAAASVAEPAPELAEPKHSSERNRASAAGGATERAAPSLEKDAGQPTSVPEHNAAPAAPAGASTAPAKGDAQQTTPEAEAKERREPSREDEAQKAKHEHRSESKAMFTDQSDPVGWMKWIIELRKAGWHPEADSELERFRDRYPDYVVPPEAQPRVAQ